MKPQTIFFGAAIIGIGFLFYRKSKSKKSNNLSLLWPSDNRTITSDFGIRIAPVSGASVNHNGIDIGCPEGSPVYSCADGVVSKVWFDATYGGGNSLRIDHGDGLSTGFAHLLSASVDVGDRVRRGQIIAYSGGRPGDPGAGISSGPHLHLTVRLDGVAVDPMPFLTAIPHCLERSS